MKRFGESLNGIGQSHKRESQAGTISTVGDGGKSISITNAGNSQLTNLVPIMPYGISSSPTIGLMSFALISQDAGRDGMLGVYDPNKPACKPGEIIIYSAGGATIKCSGSRVYINGRDILSEIDNLRR